MRTDLPGGREQLRHLAGGLAASHEFGSMLAGLLAGLLPWLYLSALIMSSQDWSPAVHAAVFWGGLLLIGGGFYALIRPFTLHHVKQQYRLAMEQLTNTKLAAVFIDDTLFHLAMDQVYRSTMNKAVLPAYPAKLRDQIRIGALFRDALAKVSTGHGLRPEDLKSGMYRLRGCDKELCIVQCSVSVLLLLFLPMVPYGTALAILIVTLMLLTHLLGVRLANRAWEAAICDYLLDEPSGRWLNGWHIDVIPQRS